MMCFCDIRDWKKKSQSVISQTQEMTVKENQKNDLHQGNTKNANGQKILTLMTSWVEGQFQNNVSSFIWIAGWL